MKTLLLIHGPNLNMLGRRDPHHYGTLTLKEIEKIAETEAQRLGFGLIAFQSNHEGALIDCLQEQTPRCAGIVINPGALTHYSYALHDALLDSGLPAVEVHLSQIRQREAWRSISVTAPACIEAIWGRREQGYRDAVALLAEHILHVG